MSAPAIRLSGVSRHYGAGAAGVTDVSLTIRPGERVGVLGASGAGKSTLLGLMNATLRPTSGTVEVLGHDLAAVSHRTLRQLRRRIGAIGQQLDLIEQVRVLHNVHAGRLAEWNSAYAMWRLAWPRADPRAQQALERVGLGWATYERTERLSGGERQRVAIARVLAQAPEVVLADEPVSSLDPTRAAEILTVIAEAGRTVVVSLHQPALARMHCDRVIGLRDGRIAFDRPASRLPAEGVDDEDLHDLYALP